MQTQEMRAKVIYEAVQIDQSIIPEIIKKSKEYLTQVKATTADNVVICKGSYYSPGDWILFGDNNDVVPVKSKDIEKYEIVADVLAADTPNKDVIDEEDLTVAQIVRSIVEGGEPADIIKEMRSELNEISKEIKAGTFGVVEEENTKEEVDA